jgi:Cytochrome c3
MTGRLAEPVKKWKTGLHAAKDISCHTCHGGDPAINGTAMSIASGFNGAPFKPFIHTFCGRCHERPLQDYLSSAHGRSREENGATCVTCHGSHQIDRASLELVNERTCSLCHTFERVLPFKNRLQLSYSRIKTIQDRLTAVKLQGKDIAELEQLFKTSKLHARGLVHLLEAGSSTPRQTSLERELDLIDKKLAEFEVNRQELLLKELLN